MQTARSDVSSGDDGIGRSKVMTEYKFYGWQTADCKPIYSTYEKIENPRHLYDILSQIWSAGNLCSTNAGKLDSGKSYFGTVFHYGFSYTGYFWREGVRNSAGRRKLSLL